jgi:hypothetical protein
MTFKTDYELSIYIEKLRAEARKAKESNSENSGGDE